MSNPLIIRDENGKLIHSMVPKEDMRKTLHECCKRTLRKRFVKQKAWREHNKEKLDEIKAREEKENVQEK